MYIKPFAVEEWMNEYEINARYNIAETLTKRLIPQARKYNRATKSSS